MRKFLLVICRFIGLPILVAGSTILLVGALIVKFGAYTAGVKSPAAILETDLSNEELERIFQEFEEARSNKDHD